MILCCGEAVTDMIPQPGQPDVYKACFGGAALNSAVALARPEVPVSLVAGLSRDPFGEQLLQELQQSGVGTEQLIRSDRPTTLAFAHLSEGDARYSFFDTGSAGRMLRADQMPVPGAGVQALLFGGISLASEPCGTAFETLARNSAGDHLIMTDPNIRPALIGDEAGYRDRLDRMFALSDIIKLSEEDMDWLGPQAVSRVFASGAGLILTTKGRQGAAGRTRNGVTADAPGQPVRVADTVGAGDTFNAAFLAALRAANLLTRPAVKNLQADQLASCLSFACRAAGISVSRTGADSPYLSELS